MPDAPTILDGGGADARATLLTRRDRRIAQAVELVGPRILNTIDAIEQHGTGRRKSPPIEMSGEDTQLANRKRLVGAALGRDLQRNVSTFRGLMQRFVVDAIGAPGPRLQPSPPPYNEDTRTIWPKATADAARSWALIAAQWFKRWAKACDAIDDTPFVEMIAQAYTAGKREGDVLWLFDDFDLDDGTIRVYESDQLPSIATDDWKKGAAQTRKTFPYKEPNPDYVRGSGAPMYVPMIQENGVVRDRRGRVHYYVCHPDHGVTLAKLKNVSIVAAWNPVRNPEGSAKLYKTHWRKSYRGTADATTIASFQSDVYEMVSHALQSAKAAHTRAGWVEQDLDSMESGAEKALRQAGIDPDKVLALAEAAATEGTEVTIDNLDDLLLTRNYKNLEKLTGGYFEYADPGDKFHFEASDQPGPNIQPFGEFLQAMSGFAMGLGKSRATGHADSAYTAFRGEDLMSWATYYWDQKSLERRLFDFATAKAIGWAIRKGHVPAPPADGWQEWFRWELPRMQEVDIMKYANALRVLLKTGERNFADVLGPDWDAKLTSFAEQVNRIQELGLPLAMLETVSGSIITDADLKDGQDNE